jgi:hypothetical protein
VGGCDDGCGGEQDDKVTTTGQQAHSSGSSFDVRGAA